MKYKTVSLGHGDSEAKPGIDYEETSGVLEFMHQESQKEIIVKILEHEDPSEERNEMFGLKLFEAEPVAVKISKKDTLVVTIVTDVA